LAASRNRLPGYIAPSAGSIAGSLCYSQDAFKRAASRDKNLHIVDGAGHVDLYDRPEFVTEVMSKLAPFYKAKL
jgi:fermentation-respiration switch protein FrsA (DUF1100 family)